MRAVEWSQRLWRAQTSLEKDSGDQKQDQLKGDELPDIPEVWRNEEDARASK